MPHCVIEYSNDLENIEKLTETIEILSKNLEDSELFTKKAIVIRAVPISIYLNGGTKEPFIHMNVRILAGRKESDKNKLSTTLLNTLTNQYDIEKISVEIADITPVGYSAK